MYWLSILRVLQFCGFLILFYFLIKARISAMLFSFESFKDTLHNLFDC